MNYMNIYPCAISDGPGVRVSFYVSGCRNHCPHCHNQESWNFNAGKFFDSVESASTIINYLDKPYIRGLTVCGGEPMEEENQRSLVSLLRYIKMKFPTKDVWLYTGYEFSDIVNGGKKHCECTDELLSYIDVAVVGPFVFSQRDITDGNRWRGSRNQKVIDLPRSLKANKEVPVEGIPNNNF